MSEYRRGISDYVQIRECSACGKDHDSLYVHDAGTGAAEPDERWWVICPETQKAVFLHPNEEGK